MLDKLVVRLVLTLLLGLCISCPLLVANRALADPSPATGQSTPLMQQMDYQRRLEAQRNAEDEKSKVNSGPLAEEASTWIDYVIIAVLAASALGFFVIARRRNRARSRRRYPFYLPRAE